MTGGKKVCTEKNAMFFGALPVVLEI